jgi:hypothetical protein
MFYTYVAKYFIWMLLMFAMIFKCFKMFLEVLCFRRMF